MAVKNAGAAQCGKVKGGLSRWCDTPVRREGFGGGL